jgi:hypothetical protein
VVFLVTARDGATRGAGVGGSVGSGSKTNKGSKFRELSDPEGVSLTCLKDPAYSDEPDFDSELSQPAILGTLLAIGALGSKLSGSI